MLRNADRVSSNNELLSGKQLCASPLNFNHLENDDIDCLEVINSPVGKWKVLDGAAVTIADDSLNCIKKKRYSRFKSSSNNNKIVQLYTESLKQSLIEPADVVRLDDFNRLNDYVKTSFTNLKYDVKQFVYVSESIKKMLENVNNICSELGVIKSSALTTVSVLNSDNLPISNEETLKNFEMFLNPLLIEIKRMMQKLFVNDWLRNYSYIGFKGKNKLSSLHSCKIIFDHNNKSGNGSRTWTYFSTMDSVIGSKPYMQPIATIFSTGEQNFSANVSSETLSSELQNKN
ncbi:hypothetical protein QTP88_028407 [Uroleucon formosanum]